MLKTPFHQFHLDHQGKMVDFASWQMPIMYSSIHEEHQMVRTHGGLFDVSHMGRIKFSGRHARKLLDRLLTRRISDMAEKTCRYSLICNERGGVMDDVLVYRFEDHWLLVVNASNREKLMAHFQAVAADMAVKIEDQTLSTAMVALQGPKVMEMIGQFSREVPALKRYAFCTKNLLVLKMIISRTGYTGEDGVEVILGANMAAMAIKLLLKEGSTDPNVVKIRPAGLGCRDTLRTEAGMPLYGHELTEEIDPISAGLSWAVSLDKDQDENGEKFIGLDALKRIAAQGPSRKLVGLKLDGKRTPRQGMHVTLHDAIVGTVTSGCLSPTLGYPIAMAYLDTAHAQASELTVDLGAQKTAAQLVPLPFYRRGATPHR